MTSAELPDNLVAAGETLAKQGQLLWRRSQDWQKLGSVPNKGERGGGLGESTPRGTLDEIVGDRQASRYHDELKGVLSRLDADSRRLLQLTGILLPDQPDFLSQDDLTPAQVAVEGFCVSCWRDDGHREPVTHDQRYRDACRFCGDWRGSEGDWPPRKIVRWRHRHPGKKVPAALVEEAKR